ncbi:MAG: replication initiation protein [Nitrospirae bacterium]|nr:replication initiation protein [Nitrospirota bacterium]
MISKNKNKALIVKANKLVEARFKLTVTEQRILLLMISQIKIDDTELKEFTFTVRDLLDALDINRPTLFNEIHSILKKFMERVVAIRLNEDENYLTHWVQTASIDIKTGIIKLSFDPNLRPYLFNLKESFTAYQLQNVIQLKSTYSIRIYELLKQYGKIGSRDFTVIDLRKTLGIQDNEYKLYGDFKQRVILPAQSELSEKTDLSFEFTEKKTGRAVTAIKFHIFTKKTVPTDNEASIDAEYTIHDEHDEAIAKMSAYEQDLFKRLQKGYKLSKKQAHIIITVHLLRKGKDHVETLLDYCYSYHQKALKVDTSAHIGAITWVAFRDGWQVQADLFNQVAVKPAIKKKEIPPEITEEEREDVKKMLKEWKKAVFKDA